MIYILNILTSKTTDSSFSVSCKNDNSIEILLVKMTRQVDYWFLLVRIYCRLHMNVILMIKPFSFNECDVFNYLLLMEIKS